MTTQDSSFESEGSSGIWPLTKRYVGLAIRRYQKLHVYGKIVLWLLLLFYICFGIFVIVVSPARIAQFLYDHATKLSHMRFGWLILSILIVVISFPPLIGHTTVTTLCGFAYGMKGFLIVSIASVIGSALVFVTLRTLFSTRLRRWSSQNKKWHALESVVRSKGLPLIILIRISPFPPWVYSNSLFASIEPVALWQFVIATLFVLPKLLLHTFIGSRMAALSDGETRGQMDSRTKMINGMLVGGGILVAVSASWLVYSLVKKHIRKLEDVPPEVDELAAEAIENYDEEAPLLSSRDA